MLNLMVDLSCNDNGEDVGGRLFIYEERIFIAKMVGTVE